MNYCTCRDTSCPFHPTNHTAGCKPCILKNWREREIPSCFFNLVGSAGDVSEYHIEDFAEYALEKTFEIPIETERLRLREMTMEDVDALSSVLGDAETMRYYPASLDHAGVERWIQRNVARYATYGFGLWAIVQKSTGKVVGDCGLTMQTINGTIRPEIGWHMRRDLWRHGYATEAGRAALDWAKRRTPFRRIYSYMLEGNAASRRVAEKLGMALTETYVGEDGVRRVAYAIEPLRF